MRRGNGEINETGKGELDREREINETGKGELERERES